MTSQDIGIGKYFSPRYKFNSDLIYTIDKLNAKVAPLS
jgi:hypothetical protein